MAQTLALKLLLLLMPEPILKKTWDLEKNLLQNIEKQNKKWKSKTKYQIILYFLLWKILCLQTFPKGLKVRINLGRRVRTESIAKSIAIPVKTPK